MNENHYLNLKSSSLTTSCLIGKLDTSVLIIYTAFNATLVTVHQNFHPVRRPGSYYIILYQVQWKCLRRLAAVWMTTLQYCLWLVCPSTYRYSIVIMTWQKIQ